ncbi:MAG: hypothetical protein LBI48_11510 [Burkholderiaceae bacterium]|jgi:hypothetical protein|nr:hypothetical protein [Burkholderiaceae bacterium]
MTILICLGVALAALPGLALAGIAWAQAAGRVDVALRVRALEISQAHKTAALAYFERVSGQVSLWRTLRDHLIAPFVLFFALRRLPWEADDLPDSLAYWRNNVSINGDGWGWRDEAGFWHQCSQEPTPPGMTSVPYTDPKYGGDAYYAPGHHPRSWYARWIWLAFRNVASKVQQDAGPLIETRPVLLAGAPLDDAPGFTLYWNGKDGEAAAYQWHAADTWGPLVMYTNVGAKLGVPYAWPETMPCRAMLIATWRAFKGGH